MDLKQLGYFVHVAELGSFTRASIVLDVAQPALSRQVRLLELELRQPLLLRNGRGVTLTDAGRMVLERGRGVLHQVGRLREDLAHIRGALTGRVALGLPPSLSRRLAVPLARACAEVMPEVFLSITEALSFTIKEALISGRLDVALLYNPPPVPEVDREFLMEEPLYLVAAARKQRRARREDRPHDGSPITLKQLATRPLIIPSRPNATRMLLEEHLSLLGLQPRIALEVDGVDTILGLVAQNVGKAVLPGSTLAHTGAPGDFVIHPISEPDLRIRVYAATSSQRPTTQAQRAMLALIRKTLGLL
jgi:LysR family transcriptional regulator, nitrogen assimilation regulatory protein